MDENMTIADLLAKRNVIDVTELWYDWFCSDKALVNRGKSLLTVSLASCAAVFLTERIVELF